MSNILQAFEDNPLVWGMYELPEHFRSKGPAFHLKIIKEAMTNKFLAVAAPRGTAKSTILTLLLPSHSIVFKKKRHILICQDTYAKSARSLENIKKEFRDNLNLKKYGIIITKDSEGDSIFRHPDGFETRILCKGAEQLGSARGEKFGPYRPDLILVDDLEDDELVRSSERRAKLKDEFDEALIPAGDIEFLNVIVIGTILHDDSLMADLVNPYKYTEYRKLLYKALKDGESIWPERYSVEYLKKLEADKPNVFAKEYQNDPSHGEMSDISKDDFRYWRIEENNYVLFGNTGEIIARGELRTCRAAIACDLAWEEKRESDSTAIVPGFLTPESYILVDDYYVRKGVKPDDFIEVVTSMSKRLQALTNYPVYLGLEKAKLEKVYKFLLLDWMKKNNFWITIKDLKWDADKIQRIMVRCQPRYSQHSIFHKNGMGELELQLTRLKSTAHDDIADALQGLIQLLDFNRSSKKNETPKDDQFMKLRKWTLEKRSGARPKHMFGKKTSFFSLKSYTCPIDFK